MFQAMLHVSSNNIVSVEPFLLFINKFFHCVEPFCNGDFGVFTYLFELQKKNIMALVDVVYQERTPILPLRHYRTFVFVYHDPWNGHFFHSTTRISFESHLSFPPISCLVALVIPPPCGLVKFWNLPRYWAERTHGVCVRLLVRNPRWTYREKKRARAVRQ